MQKYQWAAVTAIAGILACLSLGCATTTYVTSDPEGARISFNEKYQGETPLSVKVSQFQGGLQNTYVFKSEKKGFKSETRVYTGDLTQPANYVIPSRLHFKLKPIAVRTDIRPSVKREDVRKEALVAKHHGSPGGKFQYTMTSGKRWAVVIGISNYHDTRIPSLRYASVDAKSFYDWIISPDGGRFAPSRVKLLLDQDATGKNIKSALFVWLKQALEEDVVTLYFAGHGSPESPDSPNNLFLLAYDTEYDNIASTGFPMWDIETALKRFIKAKKVVVIADACHSGGVGQACAIARRASRGIKVNPISSGLQNLSKVGDGICVISASDNKQFSQESKEWGGGHGVFTYFLLKGLKGEADYNKDNSVTLGELIPYLSEQVRRATRNAQSPTVAGKFDPALNIAR